MQTKLLEFELELTRTKSEIVLLQIKPDTTSSDILIDETPIKESPATINKDTIASIVHKTLRDADRRKLSGLPESEEDGTGGDDDRSAFLVLCATHFPRSRWLLLEDADDSARGTGTNHVD